MLATKVKTNGVSIWVPKTGDYVSLVRLVGSEQELDLKGFCKHTGRNYSDDIYKVETIKPRKASCNDYVISEAFEWVQGKHGPGQYERGSGQLHLLCHQTACGTQASSMRPGPETISIVTAICRF